MQCVYKKVLIVLLCICPMMRAEDESPSSPEPASSKTSVESRIAHDAYSTFSRITDPKGYEGMLRVARTQDISSASFRYLWDVYRVELSVATVCTAYVGYHLKRALVLPAVALALMYTTRKCVERYFPDFPPRTVEDQAVEDQSKNP